MAEVDALTAQGQQEDPGNMFFPFMRAWVLLHEGQSDEARELLLQAAAAPRWNDYSFEGMRDAQWAVRAACGDTPAIVRRDAYYAGFRSYVYAAGDVPVIAARVAGGWEQRGQTEKGISLRLALIRCGKTLSESRPVDVADCGEQAMWGAIPALPGSNPDPSEYSPPSVGRAEAFATFLRQHNHFADAEWARRQLVHTLTSPAGPPHFTGFEAEHARAWCLLMWLLDAVLLSNGLALLLLCPAPGASGRPGKRIVALRFTGWVVWFVLAWARYLILDLMTRPAGFDRWSHLLPHAGRIVAAAHAVFPCLDTYCGLYIVAFLAVPVCLLGCRACYRLARLAFRSLSRRKTDAQSWNLVPSWTGKLAVTVLIVYLVCVIITGMSEQAVTTAFYLPWSSGGVGVPFGGW